MRYAAQWTTIASNQSKYVHRWDPEVPPKGCVLIVHGLGEHGARYHRLAEDWVAAEFAVVAFDQQGHGLSPEARGCIQSYSSLLDDIHAMYQWCQREYASVAPTLFGHSMGGNLVLNYALREYPRPAGVISSSPMILAMNPPSAAFERLARILLKCIPNYRLRSRVNPKHLMNSEVEQQAFREDRLFHAQLSLRLGAALIDSGRWSLEQAHTLSTPLLLTHGTADIRTCPEASQEFGRRGGPWCRVEILKDRLHDPFRDNERDEVIAMYNRFIREIALSGAH
ncbi:alpha/beta hydrolase [Aureliella helgolandensis]|uniref:Phospholipase YtpA n=1 Tax=Aureliella helgolandensis TaxID=2527968 RepID=A0A518G903_9BACT|nr:alpha/beta hydrolase [Aureliella helgolandensis]QDV25050.1 Phospholipase YtpA [Aureliella helgolandensis]